VGDEELSIVKNFHLIDWTIRQASFLKNEPGTVASVTSLDKSLNALDQEPPEQSVPSISIVPVPQIGPDLSVQFTAPAPVQSVSPEVVVQFYPDAATGSAVIGQAEPSTMTDSWVEAQMPDILKAMSKLHKAVVDPDIHTAEADRVRAIGLRWVLRDIRSGRLQSSCVDEQDLEVLAIMGLVEMRDDAPVLTSAGLHTIA
jgi:hypothetical protein